MVKIKERFLAYIQYDNVRYKNPFSIVNTEGDGMLLELPSNWKPNGKYYDYDLDYEPSLVTGWEKDGKLWWSINNSNIIKVIPAGMAIE